MIKDKENPQTPKAAAQQSSTVSALQVQPEGLTEFPLEQGLTTVTQPVMFLDVQYT